MTKKDLVGKDVEQKVYEKREEDFIEKLGLKGAEHRFLSTSNYCTDVDPKRKRLTSVIPEIDAPVLEFFMQVSEPAGRLRNEKLTYQDIHAPVVPPGGGIRQRNVRQQNVKLNQPGAIQIQNVRNITWWMYGCLILCLIGFLIWMVFSFFSETSFKFTKPK